jgi:hypothetical protein
MLHIVRHPLGTEIKSNSVVVNSSLSNFVKRLLQKTKCENRSLKWFYEK